MSGRAPSSDLAARFSGNPLLAPRDLMPSREDFEVLSVINPGVFRHAGRTWLLARVAERPAPAPGRVRIPVARDGEVRVLDLRADDPGLDVSDPREPKYKGEGLLSSVSHLRLFSSADGKTFTAADNPFLRGEGAYETYGIEDPRVTAFADGRFILTYTAVSPCGYGIGARVTRDWARFGHLGLILPIPNKDCTLFPERIDGAYAALNRPSGVIVGGHDIWLSFSPDLVHWGRHRCVARCRPGAWDGARIGVNGPPVRLPQGWLVLYHGADASKRYCLGALLLDPEDPRQVLARTREPVMQPVAPYECDGFFGRVVFSNGHVVDGDTLTLYYGASDTVTCGAGLRIRDILSALGV